MTPPPLRGAPGDPTTLWLVSSTEPRIVPWLLTGMSGAGKATALRALEAAGISCVDNLPMSMLAAFVTQPISAPAVAVIDARSGPHLDPVDGAGGVRVVFLDASDAVLVRRLADSARPHPCAAAGAGQAAVTAERAMVTGLRAAADVVIDTGALSELELSQRILDVVAPEHASTAGLRCTVSSFGFKYGPQTEADWVIDSRILPNPFWEPALRPLTGLDGPVRDFLLGHEVSREFIDRTAALLEWVVAVAQGRGRQAIHVAVGCTGGRHRSVVVAVGLAARLAAAGVTVEVRHRDVDRPDPR
jgi:RNase adapter protein RapZ